MKSGNSKPWLLGVPLIVLMTVGVYLPALRGGFIWDDDDYVTNNRTLRSAEGLREIWLNPNATVQYYPLTFTVFCIEYHLWGLRPFGFHLVNVLLQAANALLVWRLLSRLRVPGAWWAAAVFALHPVHVMSVAWVTELKNVLSGFFFLATLLAYLPYCGPEGDGTGQPSRRRWNYPLALGLYVCALLSKTSTSIMPVAALLILWWKRGRVGRKELAPLAPFFIVGILFGVFTLWLERHLKGASGPEFSLPFLDRFLVSGRSFWFCLGKLVWPARLTFIYPHWEMDAATVRPYAYPLTAIMLLATLWWTRRWIGRAPFAALVYFWLAFPALVLVQLLYMMRYTFVSDHWQYLGSLSVIALGVGGVASELDRRGAALHRLEPMIGTVVLVVLGLLAWRQERIYLDVESLWRDTLAKNPECWMAHLQLGNVLFKQDKVSEAMGEYEWALQVKPDDPEARNNLGIALQRSGKFQEAIGRYEQALQLRPNYAEARYNLGIVLEETGRIGEAIGCYEEALRIKPNYAEVHNNLGSALVRQGRTQEAIKHWEQALRINPDYAEVHYNLGVALAHLGRVQEAIGHWEQALRLKPNYAEARFNLGVVLEETGQVREAVGCYEEALRLKPNYAEAHNNLGALLARQGKIEEAMMHFQEALRLNPNYPEANNNLGTALFNSGRVEEAISRFQRALRLKPDYPEAQSNLLAAQEALKRTKESSVAPVEVK